MIFIGIPLVVRSVQPVLEKLDPQYEEAAQVLGASRSRTFFKVVLPEILPAALTGFGLAFAKSIGEYGSVVFIAGNIPYETQIVPLIIMNKLEQFNYPAATAIAFVMVVFAFLLLFGINLIQARIQKNCKGVRANEREHHKMAFDLNWSGVFRHHARIASCRRAGIFPASRL